MHDIEDAYLNPAFEPCRQRVSLEIGAFVRHGSAIYKIAQHLDFESAIGIDVETGRSMALRLGELRPVEAEVQSSTHNLDMAEIADED